MMNEPVATFGIFSQTFCGVDIFDIETEFFNANKPAGFVGEYEINPESYWAALGLTYITDSTEFMSEEWAGITLPTFVDEYPESTPNDIRMMVKRAFQGIGLDVPYKNVVWRSMLSVGNY